MEIRHLYEDSFFGSMAITMEVKDRMRTKGINAREERNFEKYMNIFQRGKEICEKNSTVEKWKMYRALNTIWERTPRLEKSLAAEKDRVEALQRALLVRVNPDKRTPAAAQEFYGNSGLNSQQVYSMVGTCATRDQRRRQKGGNGRSHKKKERPLNTDIKQGAHRYGQTTFVKRSENVIRSLSRLNRHTERRRQDHEKFKEALLKLSKPVIHQARVILRGHPDIDSNQYLDQLEKYICHGESYNITQDQNYLQTSSSVLGKAGANSVVTSWMQRLGAVRETDILSPSGPTMSNVNVSLTADKNDVITNNNYTSNTEVNIDNKNVGINFPQCLNDVADLNKLEHLQINPPSIFRRRIVPTPVEANFVSRHVPLPAISVLEVARHTSSADVHEVNIDPLHDENSNNVTDIYKGSFRLPSNIKGRFSSKGNVIANSSNIEVSNSKSRDMLNIDSHSFTKNIANTLGSNNTIIPRSNNETANRYNNSNSTIDNNNDTNTNNYSMSKDNVKSGSNSLTAGNNSLRGSYVRKEIRTFSNSSTYRAHQNSSSNQLYKMRDKSETYINKAPKNSGTSKVVSSSDTNKVLNNSDINSAVNNSETKKSLTNNDTKKALNSRDTKKAPNNSDRNIDLYNNSNTKKVLYNSNTYKVLSNSDINTSPTNKTLNNTSPTKKTLNNTSPTNKTLNNTSPTNKTLNNTSPTNKTLNNTLPTNKTLNNTDINNNNSDIMKYRNISTNNNNIFHAKHNHLGKLLFSPSVNVSQVILEEDEVASLSQIQQPRTFLQDQHLPRTR